MAQQTAVEWFEEQSKKILIDLNKNQIHFRLNLCLHEFNDLGQQAKQMEKEQIKYAWQDGFETGDLSEDDGTEYYTQTYGNNNKKD